MKLPRNGEEKAPAFLALATSIFTNTSNTTLSIARQHNNYAARCAVYAVDVDVDGIINLRGIRVRVPGTGYYYTRLPVLPYPRAGNYARNDKGN